MKQAVIYKITNPKNHIYIGQTDNLDRRISVYKSTLAKGQHKLNSSFKNYGFDNHKIDVIGTYPICFINIAEVEMIKKYNSQKNGLNISIGGKGARGFKWSEKSLDKKRKKIYKYSLDGEILNVYKSLKEAEQIEKMVVRPYTNINLSINGCVWLYENQPLPNFEEIKLKIKKGSRSKMVYQYSLSGDLVNSFYSTREAYRVTSIDYRSISQVASGSKIRRSAGGYYWSYKKDL